MICSECSGFWGHGHSCKNARPMPEVSDNVNIEKEEYKRLKADSAELAEVILKLLSFQQAIDNVGALLVETRDDLWHREAELATLKAERAADTERLRLALHACQVVKDYLTGLCGDKSDPLTAIRTIYHKPLLDAIDAARKEEQIKKLLPGEQMRVEVNRDPRVDPKAGDVLKVSRNCGVGTVVVEDLDGELLDIRHCRSGAFLCLSLDKWREWSKNFEVVHAAE